MSHVILMVETVQGVPTEHDGRWLQRYVPPKQLASGEFEGGILQSTPDLLQAMLFSDAAAALATWRLQNGLRPDGLPNRPLTAWTCEILTLEDAARR